MIDIDNRDKLDRIFYVQMLTSIISLPNYYFYMNCLRSFIG